MKTLMKKNKASWKDENFKNTFLKKLTSRIKALLLMTGILCQ